MNDTGLKSLEDHAADHGTPAASTKSTPSTKVHDPIDGIPQAPELWTDRHHAAEILKVHPDTIKKREIPWQPDRRPGQIRYTQDILDRRHLYLPDIQAKHTPVLYEPEKDGAPGRQRTLFTKEQPLGITPGRRAQTRRRVGRLAQNLLTEESKRT